MQSGVVGIYAIDLAGNLISSSFENATRLNATSGKYIIKPANESDVQVVRDSFAAIPENLTSGETVIEENGQYIFATTLMVTPNEFHAIIVTIGDAAYFKAEQNDANLASGLTLGAAVLAGAAGVAGVSFLVFTGLRSIKRSVVWLKDDQSDGSTLMLRDEEGEYDSEALRRAKQGYTLRTWFREMDKIGKSIDDLASNARDLKMFFPSVFVGMSKEDFKRGAHKTTLRTKNVSVMFVDIVKFSSLCEHIEGSLQIVLQGFLNSLESPTFKHKGLTKRLGDGFMAAFGFASDDDDLADLCKRAHSCARLIVRNLPRLNRSLRQRLALFPAEGLKVRIGISAGKAAIGVVQTDNMSNADVYGAVVNLAQRCEDSGRVKEWSSSGTPVLFTPEETPRCTVTVTQEVFDLLEVSGEFAKRGIEMVPKQIFIKNETTPRTVFVSYEHDIVPTTAETAETSGVRFA